MIDAHCHIDFDRFDDDRAEVIARAVDAGVEHLICAGYDPAGWRKQTRVASEHPEVSILFGIHPHVAAMYGPDDLEKALADLAPRVSFALGETGLDLSHYVPRGSLPRQIPAYRAQLALAREANVPIVLHILGAHGPALDIMRRDGLPKAGGMIHSFSGPAELIERYEALGLYISFAASVTRPTAKRILAAVKAVSMERLLIETDCPDQIPTGVVGGRNLPEYLPLIRDAVARVRGVEPIVVGRQSAINARRLFGLELTP